MLVGQEFKQESKHRERPYVVNGAALNAGFLCYFPADAAGPLTLNVIRKLTFSSEVSAGQLGLE
ncbi:hypothetical protein C8J25_11118 [Sphingomonas faeni]|uniref:Uncharacterized protein n=1 Tax=Sphingomonas faeni TaxID=185950 RepID=A0A2T5TY41_9SPHN|nr:hypothetical protein C8J25_11118 [Sphingomonas faeni]